VILNSSRRKSSRRRGLLCPEAIAELEQTTTSTEQGHGSAAGAGVGGLALDAPLLHLIDGVLGLRETCTRLLAVQLDRGDLLPSARELHDCGYDGPTSTMPR
jgi:hypothetical protein